MTLKDKINFLLANGHTQTSIDKATGISQSSVSKILSGDLNDVLYEKGKRLDELVTETQENPHQLAG